MALEILRHRPDLKNKLTAELAPGERILFVAQPDWRADIGMMAVIFVFALYFTGIALAFCVLSGMSLFGITPITTSEKPEGAGMALFFFLFSLPFVAVGFGMLAIPFIGIRKARNTAHAVTDARLINVYVGKDEATESYKLDAVNFITRKIKKNGTGTLSIGYGVGRDSDGDPRPLTTEWTGIPDAMRAEAIIREQAKWVR